MLSALKGEINGYWKISKDFQKNTSMNLVTL